MDAKNIKTIDEYNKSLESPSKEICDLLRKEIQSVLTKSESKVWHGHPVWFLDGNPIVGYAKLKDSVQLLFWSGQSFSTPGLEKEGSFKAAQIRFTSIDQVNKDQLSKWLDESKIVQWDYKNIVKHRGVLKKFIPNSS